jgi:hypothetical protein
MRTSRDPRSTDKLSLLCLSLVPLLWASSAEAKRLGSYQAQIVSTPPTKPTTILGKMGAALQAATAPTDWSCTAKVITIHKDGVFDHKSQFKQIQSSREQTFDLSSLESKGVPVSFDKDMRNQSSVEIMITEDCHKSVHPTDANGNWAKDKNGNLIEFTGTLHVEWPCNVSAMPKEAGKTSAMKCGQGVHRGNGETDSLLQEAKNLYASKPESFGGSIKLNQIKEQFTQKLCPASAPDPVIIQLSQGTGGHLGEDDFVFHVEIDGQHKFDIQSDSGLLNDDIAYCGPGPYQVKITATEKDLIWDDQYTGKGTHGNDSVTVNRNFPGQYGKIHLMRDTILGEMMTDQKHEISVVVVDPKAESSELRKVGTMLNDGLNRSPSSGSAAGRSNAKSKASSVGSPSSSAASIGTSAGTSAGSASGGW